MRGGEEEVGDDAPAPYVGGVEKDADKEEAGGEGEEAFDEEEGFEVQGGGNVKGLRSNVKSGEAGGMTNDESSMTNDEAAPQDDNGGNRARAGVLTCVTEVSTPLGDFWECAYTGWHAASGSIA